MSFVRCIALNECIVRVVIICRRHAHDLHVENC